MSEQLPFRIRRSAVEGKRPQNADLELGELALNTYDGRLFAKKDTGGVGVGTTVTVLTPWTETVGVGLYYTEGNVGLGTTNPTTRLWVSGDINFTGNLYQNGTIFQSGGGTSSQWTTYPAGISTLSNVGIGTTNPTTKLQVNGSVTLGAGSTDLITIPGRIASNFYPTGDGVYDIGRPTQIGLGANRWRDANFYGKGSFDSGVDAHDIEIGIGSANLIYSTFGNLELNSQSGTTNIDDNVTISGNTGIGTVTPTSKLHVVGDGRFTGEVTASDFVGNLVGVASTANNVSSTININTSGIITASSFTGNLTGIASTATTALGLSTTANINTTGIITASRLVSNVESGEPITVGSSTLVTNLNVNYLNGQPDTYYTNAGNLDSGFISSSRLSGSYGIDIVGTATTLSNAANITTGFISSSRLSGSYGIDIVGTATTANNLSNAANITTGFISSERLSGSYGIDIVGTATTATTLSNAANITTGFISSERLSGSYGIDIVGTATTLSNAANITTGFISSERLSGSYGISIVGTATTANNLSNAANITTGTIDKDRISTTNALTVLGDLYVSNNISFGGSTTQLNTQQLQIADADIILGIGTSFSPTDNTANHGGIAIASTEGFPLVNLNIVPEETNPSTYKKIMWFKGSTIGAGLTDAWLFNYGVGIGSTQVPNGVRLSVGQIQMTDSAITATTFTGNLTGTATTLSNAANITTGFISSSRLSGSYGIDITGTATTANNLSDAANITTGFISSSRLSGSYGIDIVGTATTANNLSNAANITTGFISSSRLSGSYGISITGTATTLSNAANITTGFISSERLSGSYGISITGTATTATTALGFSTTASINTSGIITAVRFSGDGSLLTGITTSGSGVVIRNNGSAVGTAGTIDFASNLSVSFGSGIATISATGGSGGTSSQWITTPTGISTTSNVGIGSTSPIVPLDVVGGAKFTGIITATQLDLSENASTDDSVLYLSGAPLGTSTKNGLLGIGQLSFSDTDIIANFTHNTNGYAQVVVQNKNSGASSSADIIVNNDRTAGTTYYGDFGINGTTFSGVGPFADPDGTYLYSAGGTLTLGSLDAYALKLATNNTERVRIDGTNVGIGTTNPSQTLHVQGNARITGAIYDSTNSTGTSGQVLQSTATGTEWTTAAGGGTNLGLVVASTYNMFMP
jgi:hypothetical protein